MRVLHTTQPKISIVVPIYNVEPYIACCCESIKKFNNIEVILIDDGSPDNSMEIAKHILPNAQIITQPNQGLSASRNVGIKCATGEYILFLDSDDYLLELPKICGNHQVYYGKCIVSSSGKAKYSYLDAWSYIVNRKFIIKNQLFFEEGKLCESVSWVTELRKKTEDIKKLDIAYYGYRHKRDGSIMNTMDSQRIIDLNDVVKKYKTPRLLFQSWVYINEYLLFEAGDRVRLRESYKGLWPLCLLASTSLTLLTFKKIVRFFR